MNQMEKQENGLPRCSRKERRKEGRKEVGRVEGKMEKRKEHSKEGRKEKERNHPGNSAGTGSHRQGVSTGTRQSFQGSLLVSTTLFLSSLHNKLPNNSDNVSFIFEH